MKIREKKQRIVNIASEISEDVNDENLRPKSDNPKITFRKSKSG